MVTYVWRSVIVRGQPRPSQGAVFTAEYLGTPPAEQTAATLVAEVIRGEGGVDEQPQSLIWF